MEPVQLRFALTTSILLVVLGVVLASSGLADWGLAIVALMLLATTAVSWWRGRPELEVGTESAMGAAAARVSAQ